MQSKIYLNEKVLFCMKKMQDRSRPTSVLNSVTSQHFCACLAVSGTERARGALTVLGQYAVESGLQDPGCLLTKAFQVS